MQKCFCGGFYVEDGAVEIRDGKKFLKTGNGGDEPKSYDVYTMHLDEGSHSYIVENVTSGEIDPSPGGAVSLELLEQYQKDKIGLCNRFVDIEHIGNVDYCVFTPAKGFSSDEDVVAIAFEESVAIWGNGVWNA